MEKIIKAIESHIEIINKAKSHFRISELEYKELTKIQEVYMAALMSIVSMQQKESILWEKVGYLRDREAKEDGETGDSEEPQTPFVIDLSDLIGKIGDINIAEVQKGIWRSVEKNTGWEKKSDD